MTIPHIFAEFCQSTSPQRLEAYRRVGDDDLETLTRYVWNISLCEAFYPTLQNMEIGLRNGLNQSLTAHFGDPLWFQRTPSVLDGRGQRAITEAEQNLLRQQRPVEPGRVVAELNFGFWTSLFATRYERVFWNRPAIYRTAFPNLPTRQRTRSVLARRFNDVRLFRNRVFHHEPILYARPLHNHTLIVEAMDWLNPTLQEINQSINRFSEVHSVAYYGQLKDKLAKVM